MGSPLRSPPAQVPPGLSPLAPAPMEVRQQGSCLGSGCCGGFEGTQTCFEHPEPQTTLRLAEPHPQNIPTA